MEDANAVWLSDKEEKVYKLLISGLSASEISKTTGFRTSSLHSIIKRLLNLRLIEKHRGKGNSLEYRSLAISYNVMHAKELRGKRTEKTYQLRHIGVEPYTEVVLSESQTVFLWQHYDMDRSELAKWLGLPRYVVCRELIKHQLNKE